jgi:SAM-dependent methyltransferase
MNVSAATISLIDEASAPYRAADHFAYFRARSKLRTDPAFTGILARGVLGTSQRILDLGCGQGLLAAWLLAARSRHARNRAWPAGWPAPPQPTSIRGIELKERDVRRAQCALGSQAAFELGDIIQADYGTADAIVILDVLHYIDYRAQERVLKRACSALSAGGFLLLRVGDAAGGIRFAMGKRVDQTVLLALEYKSPKLYCRSAQEWRDALADGGFVTEALPVSAGTSFANIMLIARPR